MIFSKELFTALDENLAAGRQSMLFVNRRGFAPIVQCRKCGWHAQCPDCSVGMTYHKRLGKLLCHICGRTMPMSTGPINEKYHDLCEGKSHDARKTDEAVYHTAKRSDKAAGDLTRTLRAASNQTNNGEFPLERIPYVHRENSCSCFDSSAANHQIFRKRGLMCPECKSDDLSVAGIGVEKVEAAIKDLWPHARTAIVSSDTMQSRQALERLVAQMESGEIDIIIGTQIMAKGHHFPNLTLVGVIDADQGLFGNDFRAGERTFQQLLQVAGRAGRGDIKGRVILQTRSPDHPVIRAVAANDRDNLMQMDLEGRRAAGMPPFGQLIALVVEGQNENKLKDFCNALSAAAPRADGVKIMGPVPAQIYQVRNWFRYRFLVAARGRAALQPLVHAWVDKVKIPSNIRLKIDVNPQNFL